MELLDICDEQGNPTGETVERDIAHRDGILHRTAHVWIVRNKEKGFDILLQKRSMEKESFPEKWNGAEEAGETPMRYLTRYRCRAFKTFINICRSMPA